ncbi:ABC transporter permease [Paenibacillus sp. DS2015]|uniref:ABC transporter permease n=1 Tax=Paenibacillus sp. DS2015 TaxID=3373917 RepID=UPI003D219A25
MIILILLPIVMSKIIIEVIDANVNNFMLLSTWILFAQVMVGIMITGPNLIEERESKTMDALLVSPLSFRQILVAKSLAVLLFSLLSQVLVLLINDGLNSGLVLSLLYMVLGGVVFVQIGLIIGLKVNSSKTGSAISSALMIVFFLVPTLYLFLPDWSYIFVVIIPSIEIVENLNSVLNVTGIMFTETLLLVLWIVILALWIRWGEEYETTIDF